MSLLRIHSERLANAGSLFCPTFTVLFAGLSWCFLSHTAARQQRLDLFSSREAWDAVERVPTDSRKRSNIKSCGNAGICL